MRYLIFIFLLCSCSAISKEEVATDILLVADWSQTRQIARVPEMDWHEHNLYLGEHPSEGKINGYFAACLVANTVLNRIMPKDYLPFYQYGIIAVEVGAISNNYSIGLDVKF